MSEKRVVITGLGAVTPLGNDVKTFWQHALEGKPGAQPITKFDAQNFKTRFACEVNDFDPALYLEPQEIKRSDLFTQYALFTATQAIQNAGLELEKIDPLDVGVIWGSGQGGMKTFEKEVQSYVENQYQPRFNPFFVPKMIINIAAGMIAIKHGLMGINYSTVSACATSNTAIMNAYHYIKMGKAKIFVTGGSEAPLTEASVGGFNALKALSTRNDAPEEASRPFDTDRDGFVMGEGAGALILEDYDHARKRGATIYAELVGASMTADAYHMTGTHPEGQGAYQAMKLALKEGGVAPDQVDYLNAHATSTPGGDLSEVKAILKTFGSDPEHLSISGTKSMTGHLLGAAGVVEAILTIKAINENVIPPTINTQNLDPEIPEHLQIVTREPLEKKVSVGLSNAFGFGGHNGSLVFREV